MGLVTLGFPWKTFKVDLADLAKWLQSNAKPAYCGFSANELLEIHFTDEPSYQIKERLQQKWDGMVEADEADKLALAAKKAKALMAAISAIPYADIITLNAAEKKIIMNLPLDDADRLSLVAKYKDYL
jgi:hypothetical protein